MKYTFVFDENVMIFAQKREDASGDPDDTCFQVVTQAIGNCHCLAISSKVWKLYYAQLNALGRDSLLEPRVLALLAHAAVNPQKVQPVNDVPDLEGEEVLSIRDENDLHFVRLAVAARAILVTNDSGLIDLDTCGKMGEYGSRIVRPQKALSWASQVDP
ncbi:MAG: hypothetical protein HYY01_08020 [Chloroflexi bacterium]|nr:hypothetical protein [Chloroflexota bacterium]